MAGFFGAIKVAADVRIAAVKRVYSTPVTRARAAVSLAFLWDIGHYVVDKPRPVK